MLRYTLRQLEYFVAVGEAGSIALASEKVNVSSPSISAAITQLEQEFGLPLFVRQHAQGLSLTQAGRRMLDQARLILQEAEALNALANDISGSARGPLAIGCLLTFAQVLLPSLRRSFEAMYPEVRISQAELNQAELFSALRRADIDVALTYDMDLPGDLSFTPLRQLPPLVLVNETHPLADRSAVTATDLLSHPMVLIDLPVSSDYFMSFFAGAGGKPIIAERTRDMAVMRSLVGNGFGYSFANMRPLNDRSPDGHLLRFIPLVGDVSPLSVGLLMSPAADNANVVRAFAEHVQTRSDAGDLPGLDTSS